MSTSMPTRTTMPTAAPVPTWTRAHLQRLRQLWRSAGWPSHDGVELDLLAAGALQRHVDGAGRETLQLTELGLARLAGERSRTRGRQDAHEHLVGRAAGALAADGRWAWRGLRLLAPLPEPGGCRSSPWVGCAPDLFSIRPSTREDGLDPVVHEIKVSRADLLADRRRPAKAAAYEGLAGAVIYVLAEGIGDAEDVPEAFGVWRAHGHGFELLRPPRRRPTRLSHGTWLALARATPCAGVDRADAGPEAAPGDGQPAPADVGPWQWPLAASLQVSGEWTG
jgi:hypothetical protein